MKTSSELWDKCGVPLRLSLTFGFIINSGQRQYESSVDAGVCHLILKKCSAINSLTLSERCFSLTPSPGDFLLNVQRLLLLPEWTPCWFCLVILLELLNHVGSIEWWLTTTTSANIHNAVCLTAFIIQSQVLLHGRLFLVLLLLLVADSQPW